jgi:hypothetical protein
MLNCCNLPAQYFADGKFIVEFVMGLLGFITIFGSFFNCNTEENFAKPIQELVNSFCLLILLSHTMKHIWY